MLQSSLHPAGGGAVRLCVDVLILLVLRYITSKDFGAAVLGQMTCGTGGAVYHHEADE